MLRTSYGSEPLEWLWLLPLEGFWRELREMVRASLRAVAILEKRSVKATVSKKAKVTCTPGKVTLSS